MRTMHPTLLIGPADWDGARWPREEFARRLAALWRDHPDAAGALVYGNASEHAGLAYLTHFTPKLEAALALIPRDGAPRLLVGGGVNMVPAARPLTFVEDLGLLRGAASAIEWVRALPTGSCVLIGGDTMPYELRSALDAALGQRLTSGDERLWLRMRAKSPRELGAIRTACETLEAVATALRKSLYSGRGVTDCVLAAEHAALEAGAQDMRSLFSLDRGFSLRPFDRPIPDRADPLQVYLAVRNGGYWAEAFVSLSVSGQPNALQTRAHGTIDAMVAAVRPGVSAADLWQMIDKHRGDLDHHPITKSACGSSIGLAVDEQLLRMEARDLRLGPGEVYSLRAGLRDQNGSAAVASAMLIVTDVGCERIWPPRSASGVVSGVPT